MNLTYSIIGCQLIKMANLIVWALKYMSCVICSFFNKLVCSFTCIVENFCNTGVRKLCGVGMCWCFFLSRKTKNSIANIAVEFVSCWARIVVKIVETFEKIACEVLPLCYFHVLDYIVAVFILSITWTTKTVDWMITWVLCLTYIGDGVSKIGNLFTKETRLLTLAPIVLTDKDGYSDWFVYTTKNDDKFILGSKGECLLPYRLDKFPVCVDPKSKCKKSCKKPKNDCSLNCNDCGEFIYIDADLWNRKQKVLQGEPLMYFAEKIVEITDRLMSGSFADDNDNGDSDKCDITQYIYGANVKDQYNNNKIKDIPNSVDQIGLKTHGFDENTKFSELVDHPDPTFKFNKYVRYRDHGVRILTQDIDDCGNDTSINTHVTLHCNGFRFLCNERLHDIEADHTFDINDYKFLLENKNTECNVLTVYFVDKYTEKEGDLSCADLLGYVFCSFRHSDGTPKFVKHMDPISNVETLLDKLEKKQKVVNVAEDLIHSVCHQVGLMHTLDEVEDDDMRRDDIVRIMYRKIEPKSCIKKKCNDPCGKTEHSKIIRRVLTPMEWCMLRDSGYLSRGCKKTEHFFATDPVFNC